MNNDIMDSWTWGHIALGFVMGRAKFSFSSVVFIAIAWELIEPGLKSSYPDAFPHNSVDSNLNKLGDVMGVLLGYYAGRKS